MFVFENVFKAVSREKSEKIQAFWIMEGAITDETEAARRATHVVYMVLERDSGAIASVSTAELKKVNALNNNYLYEFRCYVGKKFRVAGLDVKISQLTLEYLETFTKSEPEKPVGVFSVVENNMLKTESAWRRAVWPELKMQFIGYTSKGDHIRVRYFKGAKI